MSPFGYIAVLLLMCSCLVLCVILLITHKEVRILQNRLSAIEKKLGIESPEKK